MHPVPLCSAHCTTGWRDWMRLCNVDHVHLASSNTGSFTETELGEIRFPEISTPILEKVCQYFYYKLRWANA